MSVAAVKHEDVLKERKAAWFTAYAAKLGKRFMPFLKCLNAARDLEDESWNIVETGSIRTLGNWQGDGNSTIILAQFAQEMERDFFTVDISADAVSIAWQATAPWRTFVHPICANSVDFLEFFQGQIGFLYLDSMDCFAGAGPEGGAYQVGPAQRHQLAELEAAWSHLIHGAIVLLDDHPGKTELAIEVLRERGAENIVDAAQSGWRIP